MGSLGSVLLRRARDELATCLPRHGVPPALAERAARCACRCCHMRPAQGIKNSLAMMCKTKSTVINLDKESYTMG